jgi:hypothetical protein
LEDGGRITVLFQVRLLVGNGGLRTLLMRVWCATSSEMLRGDYTFMLAHKDLEGLILLLLA